MESPRTHSLSEEPLEDLLLAMEAKGESAELRVKTSIGDAQLHIDRGRMSLAAFGAQLGADAVTSLLSYREGTYQVDYVPEGAGPTEHLESIGRLLRDKERKSTRTAASAQRKSHRVFSALARTSAQLPSGLSSAELRCLAAVDGRTTVLNIVRTSKDSSLEALAAIHALFELGLVTEVQAVSASPTLTMGSHAPDRTSSQPPAEPKSKRFSSHSSKNAAPGGAQRTTPLPPESGGTFENVDPEALPLGRKSTGRWAKNRAKRDALDFTGYSSVPPPALAAEQVHLPRSLKSPHNGVEAARSTADHAPFDDNAHTETQERQAQPRRLTRHDTPTALSAATVRSERAYPQLSYQLRDSEIPVPSTRLDPETLGQLDELNAALKSSRHPRSISSPTHERPLPSEPRTSEPAPSSLGLGLGLLPGELPPPGSVPHPGELPGTPDDEASTGLPRVGRYEVLARLKRGGMGSVYMCRLSGTAGFRRLFAMKVLHGHLAEQSQSLEAFFHEARVLGELHHPNIVGIADVGTPHEPYIVMDYVEGGSLAELYRATASSRDPALVVTIVLDALSGLGYAHSAVDENGELLDLVHCDVTPHNLLVGIDGTCRVTDFGIARTRRESGGPSVVQGKPGYLAPERLRNAPADKRADVFSMGVVLYVGLTGVEPFRGATPEEGTELLLHSKVRPPSEVGFRPSPALDWVVMTALSIDPASRFGSAEEMASHLRRIAERENMIAPTVDVARWVRASLGPTLAARRAASQRGTGHTDPPPPAVAKSPSQIPPPAEQNRPPSDAPSSAEITGPLEPPKGLAFDENTEIIRERGRPEDDTSANPTAKYVMVAALLIGAGMAAWAVLQPQSFNRLFKMAPATQSLTEASPSLPTQRAAPTTTAETKPSPRKSIEIDEDGNVVLPPIRTSGDE